MVVDGEGGWKVKQNGYGAKVASFQLVCIIKTRTNIFSFSLGLNRTLVSALTQTSMKTVHSVTLPTFSALQVFFYVENFMTAISCNIKHYCPTLCAWDLPLQQNTKSSRLADWLLSCWVLHVIIPCYMCYWSPALTAKCGGTETEQKCCWQPLPPSCFCLWFHDV